ncbi:MULTISPECIES: hypothetical protein [unclassified Aureispira]|uniref:hypothetical protein n=1 Tax=unclassified Aureispira TaxID=2649989 RepID=UPI0006970349|nr:MULTISPECIES: hypothetical protein [unclassified Aureispira]WMX12325.1 hypothetical protein QP953_15965 [Aureispira sp. CCB-E]
MKIICFFVLFFLLFNCTPPSVTYDRIIENNSSYDIWVNPPNNCFQDSILIPSNTHRILEGTIERNGSVNNFRDCPSICIDTAGTSISNHDSLSLNFVLEPTHPNWQYRVVQPGESGSCECRITITDADIN